MSALAATKPVARAVLTALSTVRRADPAERGKWPKIACLARSSDHCLILPASPLSPSPTHFLPPALPRASRHSGAEQRLSQRQRSSLPPPRLAGCECGGKCASGCRSREAQSKRMERVDGCAPGEESRETWCRSRADLPRLRDKGAAGLTHQSDECRREADETCAGVM